jgi:hypothetical protein
LRAFIEPPAITINKSWEFLLMEASRRRDEGNSPEGEVVETEVSQEIPPPPELPEGPLVLPEVRISREKRDPAQINEMAVFASDGQVLYEWQCSDIEARKRLLEFVSEQSRQMAQGLELGRFDLVEIISAGNQAVAQIQDDTGIYVALSKAAVARPSAN